MCFIAASSIPSTALPFIMKESNGCKHTRGDNDLFTFVCRIIMEEKMNTLSRNLFGIIILAWLGLSSAACSLFTLAPATTPTPTITATATATATNTPTPTPFNKEGWWGGEMSSDATFGGAIEFSVENNRLNEVTLNYTMRVGGCSEMVVMRGTFDETKMTGNDFTALAGLSHHKSQLIITGTVTSPSAASGTLEFKGNMDSCGEFSKSAKWSARSIPPRPTRTPTPPPPTATQPRPTATRVPATPVGADTPAGWTTLKSARFAITVPSSFQTEIALRDVRLDPGKAQLILLGEDRETGMKIGVTESPALFGNAQKKLENRKSDFDFGRGTTTLLKAQTGITVNGRDAAILEFTRGGLAIVECFIVVGQEEFDIIIEQAKANDANFIARAEQIANSFLVDTVATRTTSTAPKTVAPENSRAVAVARAFFAALNARDLDAAFQYLDDSALGVIPGNTQPSNKANLRAYLQTQLAAGAQYTIPNFVAVMDEGVTFQLKVSTNPAIAKATIVLSQESKILGLIVE
jgi:hypothetical protein